MSNNGLHSGLLVRISYRVSLINHPWVVNGEATILFGVVDFRVPLGFFVDLEF